MSNRPTYFCGNCRKGFGDGSIYLSQEKVKVATCPYCGATGGYEHFTIAAQTAIFAGDTVKHIPSGETWIVCGVRQHGRDELIPCGYPFPSFAEITDCKLIKSGGGQSEDMKDALRRAGYETYIEAYSAAPFAKKYKIITLCGSTRFKAEFEQINKKLTLAGNVVISVGCFGHNGDIITGEKKRIIDDIHKQKIDMSDEIFVINKDGYIGSSTKGEIEYAKKHGKKITYLTEVKQ